jgi:hypothetical protein
MLHLDSIAALAAELRSRPKCQLIALDGALAAGKSTLSRQLAALLDARVVEADLFLVGSSASHLDALDLKCLSGVLERARAFSGPVIFDSILMRLVLVRMPIKPDVYVYVRQCWPAGTPTSPTLFQSRTADSPALAEPTEVALAEGPMESMARLYREVLKYHYLERPQDSADILYDAVFNRPQ